MKKTLLAFLMFFALTGQSICHADGNELLSQCKISSDIPSVRNWEQLCKAQYCDGVVSGAVGVGRFLTPRPFCTPGSVTLGQMVRIVVKFLENHPELLHEKNEGLFVVAALSEAFPCKEKPNEKQ